MPAIDPFTQINRCMEEVEASILELEKSTGNSALIERIWNALGLNALRLSSPMPASLLDLLKDGVVQPDQKTVDVLLELSDVVQRLLHHVAETVHGPRSPEPSASTRSATEEPLEERFESSREEEVSPDIHPTPDSSQAEATENSIVSVPATAPARQETAVQTMKVSTGKLDRVMQLVSELAVSRTVLSQHPHIHCAGGKDVEVGLLEMAGFLDNLLVELTDIRRVPLHSTFVRMTRLVRELAGQTGKQVELTCLGGEVELDKTIVDELNDPLLHLLRNAVDHGIDPPEQRRALNKPEQGRIVLRATYQDDAAIIEIQDDGKGIDADKVLQKARENGLIDERKNYSSRDIFSLILLPGFSTAGTVSNISGRGVGMDVVAQGLKAMDGELEISSEKNQGTTFKIRIPKRRNLTGIFKGMEVKVGGHLLLIPSQVVSEIQHIDAGKVSTMAGGREVATIRGHVYSLVRLDVVLGCDAICGDAQDVYVVLVEVGGERVAFVVDEVLGEGQAVVRSLVGYRRIFDIPLFSGVALMGDRMGLVLDVDHLMAEAFKRPPVRCRMTC
ncbi:chemotaxis protein CheA [Desulfonatronum lacustre]|uniref:chemotaxis protein CheA n=1 Tax=Desulfonatronum lacustre TaxID=66849 RepID=UPI0004B77A75|nr:chemotaxis protein CheW [Desulfonatronum lacustre]